jgi:hypothetical protein
MSKQKTYLGLAVSGQAASRIFNNCNSASTFTGVPPLDCFLNIPKSIPTPDCTVCCPNDTGLLTVPNIPINGLGLSFRDIAQQLCLFKNNLKSYSLSQQFLSNPYNQSYETINNLDRLWARLANQTVNDSSGIPAGYGKRILFCANDGNVFIDVSTFYQNTKWMNYSMVALNKFTNYKFINNPTEPQYNINVNSQSQTFNYEDTNWYNVTTDSSEQSKKFTTLKCGSTSPPPSDPNNLTPQGTTAVSFLEVDLHTTRKEIIQSITQPYGWSSRYSETVFSPNYYVATQLNGVDGYNIFVRLSYYVL